MLPFIPYFHYNLSAEKPGVSNWYFSIACICVIAHSQDSWTCSSVLFFLQICIDPKAWWLMFEVFWPQFPNSKNRNPHMKVLPLAMISVLTTAEGAEGWKTTMARIWSENSDPAMAQLLSGFQPCYMWDVWFQTNHRLSFLTNQTIMPTTHLTR